MNEEFTAKRSPVEELKMPTTDLNPSPVAAQTEDWGMTNPLGTPPGGMKNGGDGWRMPEPVFRVSDGFCPLKTDGKAKPDGKAPEFSAPPKQTPTPNEPLANLYAPPENEAAEDVSQHTMHNLSLSDLSLPVPELAPASTKTAAAPQPNISEEFVVKPSAAPEISAPKQQNETMRLFFVALGILAMLAFAVGFLALVYFLFFYKTAE